MINSITNLKHKTIVTLMYATGIRISELINLDVSHVLIDRAQLKVVKGKGGKDRIIAIPDIVLDLLLVYLDIYGPRRILIESYTKGQRYSSSSVAKIIKRAASKAGVPFSVSAHSLRYAYATHHIENGTDLVSLQQQLGHHNITTTIKYVKLCKLNHRHINHPILKLNIKPPHKIT
jgi:site-specific recombinase XerD